MDQSVITRRIVVAGGVFAPGHLGELTRIVPFEMVDAVLADCRCVQRRVRKLPALVVSIVLLAVTLLIRLRTTRTCQLTPQAGSSPGSPR